MSWPVFASIATAVFCAAPYSTPWKAAVSSGGTRPPVLSNDHSLRPVEPSIPNASTALYEQASTDVPSYAQVTGWLPSASSIPLNDVTVRPLARSTTCRVVGSLELPLADEM